MKAKDEAVEQDKTTVVGVSLWSRRIAVMGGHDCCEKDELLK